MLSMYPATTGIPTFDRLSRELDRLLDSPARSGAASSRWPALNVWQEGQELLFEAEIPGFAMQDIEVLATEDGVTLRGRREPVQREGAKPIRVERTVRSFDRSIRLPVQIDPDSVRATLRDGVLRVTMPVAASARPRRIELQSSDESPRLEASQAQG